MRVSYVLKRLKATRYIEQNQEKVKEYKEQIKKIIPEK